MIINPDDNGDETQYIISDKPFWTCGYIQGDSEARDYTPKETPTKPPNKVASWIQYEGPDGIVVQEGFGGSCDEGYSLIDGEWVITDQDKVDQYWDEFVAEATNRGITLPPKEEN